MKITKVTVRKVDDGKMKGIANVLLDDCFAVHDIRIIEANNNLMLAMPSRKTITGGFRDLVHPINQETRTLFEDAIFEEYNKEV